MKAARIVTDLMLLAGAGAVTYGVWAMLPPAGFIAGGALLLAAALARGQAESIAVSRDKK